MHELAVTKNIIKIIKEESKKRKLRKATKAALSVGTLTTYRKEPILFFFDNLKKDEPLLQDTELEITEIKAQVRCNDCKRKSTVEEPYMVFCSVCNSNNVEIIKGQDFFLDQITGE